MAAKHCKYVNSGTLYITRDAAALYTRCFSFSMLGNEYVPVKDGMNGGTTHAVHPLAEFVGNPEDIIYRDWNFTLKRDCGIHEYMLTEPELSDFPETMTVGGGSRCDNAQCKHCFRKGVVNPDGSADEREFKLALEALRNVPFKTLTVSNFCEFMSYEWAEDFLKKPNTWESVNVLTNGASITPEALSSLPEKVRFTVSIDGTREEVFRELRGNSDYHQVMEMTARLVEQNRLHLVDYTVYRENIRDAYRIPEWAKANGFADKLFIGFDLNGHKHRYHHSFRILANCLRKGCALPENSERIRAYMERFPDKDPYWSGALNTEET
jgi:hypothetical protein